MQHNEATIQKLGVNPASWAWFNKDYSKYTGEQQPSAPKEPKTMAAEPFAPKVFAASLALFIGYAASFLHPWFVSGDFPLVNAITGVVLLVGIVLCVFALLIPGLIIVGIALVLAVVDFFTGHVTEGFFLLGSIAVGFAAVSVFIYSLPTEERSARERSASSSSKVIETQGKRVFGAPGGVGGAVDKFGSQAVNAGVAGERSTAALLDLLLRIPGVTIYHGLKFPGSDTADVDHAVVHGRRVFLIDSKQYRSGEYRWLTKHDGWSPVADNGWQTRAEVIKGGGHEYDNSMSAAHEGFKELLGGKVVLSSLVLVHGKDIKIGSPSDSPSGVKLCDADYAMRLMGAAFDLNLPKWKDDKRVLSTMLRQLK